MKSLAASSAVLALAACSSQLPLDDDPQPLPPGQGIAAVVLDAPSRIREVQFAPRFPGGGKFEVPDTQGGATLYLIPVQAGRYCLQHFYYEGHRVDSKEDLGCFTVIAGHITYSGDIVPELKQFNAHDNTTIYTRQDHEPALFRKLLQAGYPKIAAAYPLAAPAPVSLQPGMDPPSADAELGFWYEFGPDGTESIEVQNNTSWNMKITHLQLVECENLAQPCADLPLNVVLGPFESRKLLTLGPADRRQAYSFRYRYWDERVQ